MRNWLIKKLGGYTKKEYRLIESSERSLQKQLLLHKSTADLMQALLNLRVSRDAVHHKYKLTTPSGRNIYIKDEELIV